MSLLPNAVGRLDNVVAAIRDGDRDRVIELLQAEKERLKAKRTANFDEGTKIYKAIESVSWFLIDCENDDEKCREVLRACGWSGNDSHDLPEQDLPLVKPALKAKELPIGTVMVLGPRQYTYRQNYGHGGNGKEPYMISSLAFYDKTRFEERTFLVEEIQELIDRGVRFELPKGGEDEG